MNWSVFQARCREGGREGERDSDLEWTSPKGRETENGIKDTCVLGLPDSQSPAWFRRDSGRWSWTRCVAPSCNSAVIVYPSRATGSHKEKYT